MKCEVKVLLQHQISLQLPLLLSTCGLLKSFFDRFGGKGSAKNLDKRFRL